MIGCLALGLLLLLCSLPTSNQVTFASFSGTHPASYFDLGDHDMNTIFRVKLTLAQAGTNPLVTLYSGADVDNLFQKATSAKFDELTYYLVTIASTPEHFWLRVTAPPDYSAYHMQIEILD